MNAVSRDYDIATPYERSFARIDGRARSVLECDLQQWGKWWEERAEFEGHATMSAITAFLEGFGGGIFGDRVLCKEMPKHVYSMHQRFLRLNDNEREVVWNHYVAAVNPTTGRCPTEAEKAWLLGLSYGNYRVRLTRARFKLLGIEPVQNLLAVEVPERGLTDAEGDAALAEFRAADKTKAPCQKLAKKYGVSWRAMRDALASAAARESAKTQD